MARLNVRKTYKLYINGEFPRTESGRFYAAKSEGGELLANACRGSRKDLRNAIQAARKAFPGWSGKTAYNRGQILYRIAEVCESRAAELADELRKQGVPAVEARKEIDAVIDRWVYYAGWSDKYTQVVGSVNPVVAIPSESRPLAAITLGEVFQTSDVPGGVVNIVSGLKSELIPWLASHMDVNAIDATGVAAEGLAALQKAAAENVKRIVRFDADAIGWADTRLS